MLVFLKSCRRSIQRKWDRLRAFNLAIKTIVFSDDLLVRSLAGNSRSLILVFSGSSVKRKIDSKRVLRGGKPAEFAIIASHGFKNHVLFINDLAASYFSQDGMRDRALRVITDYALPTFARLDRPWGALVRFYFPRIYQSGPSQRLLQPCPSSLTSLIIWIGTHIVPASGLIS